MDAAWAQTIEYLSGRRIVVVSGAGCSTESGIPDYRGEETARRARTPIQYKQFIGRPEARQRYWARSMVGWPTMSDARPNDAHRALAALETAGHIAGVITQNVDGLHQEAGSRRVIELHGSLAEVICLDCGAIELRRHLQERLHASNPAWASIEAPAPAPDGDAHLESYEGFIVPACQACGGVLKPHVVFFGENVPRSKSEAAWTLWNEADVLLVVGSSLAVLSGYRFVKKAPARGLPVVIINRGPTRGDGEASLRVDARLGAILPVVADALGCVASSPRIR
ncbi:MAG: NAD-dependent protein deacetylase [Myxococcota bacterium]